MAAFGDFVWCRDDQVQEAKELLLEQMIDMIRNLAQHDDFWDITRNLSSIVPKDIRVAYKIVIPNLDEDMFMIDPPEGGPL